MSWVSSFLMLVGRILLAAIFLLSAYGKVVHYDMTQSFMASKGLPLVPLLLMISIVIEFLGGLALLFGVKVRSAATLLFLYLIPVTFLMHDFWMIGDAMQKQDNFYHFQKNLAIMGGLLYVAATGAGYFGFDRCSYACKKDKEGETVEIKK